MGTVKTPTTGGGGVELSLISLLGTIFSLFGIVLTLRRGNKKISNKLKLDLLSASAGLIAELAFCKDVHHHFHSFIGSSYKPFLSQTEKDFGDNGVLSRLQSKKTSAENHRVEWQELCRRFKEAWHVVQRYQARDMSQVLTRASNTNTMPLETRNVKWGSQLPRSTREDAELLVIEFQEMLQSIDDFKRVFDVVSTARSVGSRDQIRRVPALLVDLGDRAEDVMLHADGTIVASVAILDEVNRALFDGGEA